MEYYYRSRQRSSFVRFEGRGQRFVSTAIRFFDSFDARTSLLGNSIPVPRAGGSVYRALYINCLGLIEHGLSTAKIYRGVKD